MSTGTSERKRIHAIKTLRSDFVALLILHDERRDHSDKRNETNPGGQIVDEISSSGQKTMSYVYDPSGGLMATQKLVTPNDVATYVAWNQTDPSGASVRLSNTSANLVTNLSAELDATGGNNELDDPATNPPPAGPPDENSPSVLSFGNPSRPSRGCTFNGIPLPDCGFILQDVDPFDIQHELFMPHLRDYDVDTHDGIQHFGLDKAGATALAQQLHGTLIRNWIVSSNGSGDFSMFGQQPQNPLSRFASNTRLSDEECDKKLSRIFGGFAKAMVNSDMGQPAGRGSYGHSATPRNDLSATEYDPVDNITRRRADRGGIIHTYTDSAGSDRNDVPLTTPAGWTGRPIAYYVGDNSGLIFNYAGGITIEFVHVGTTNSNNVPSIPRNVANSDGVVQIGYVGGKGGEGGNYFHTHIVFFSNKAKNERIDPRVLFCGFPK